MSRLLILRFLPPSGVLSSPRNVSAAFQVLKAGLARHPHYLAGRVVLAHVYYDTGQYRQVLKVLRPLVATNRDHYVLQKLYAQSNLQLGFKEEALAVLKNLHFLNPKDREIADALRQIEPSPSPATRLAQPTSPPIPIEEWVQVDFDRKATVEKQGKSEEGAPITTHTLVDLYQKQGMVHKAIEVLEKMVEHDPGDVTSKERLKELKRDFPFQLSEQQNLMDVWDKQFSEKFRHGQLEKVLLNFLHAIKLKQNEKSTCYHGPNLNLLGEREVHFYGGQSLEEIKNYTGQRLANEDVSMEWFQSNQESKILDKIQGAKAYHGIVLNPGALSHSSFALYDCLKAAPCPVLRPTSPIPIVEDFLEVTGCRPRLVGELLRDWEKMSIIWEYYHF